MRPAIIVRQQDGAPKVFLGIRTIFIELDLVLCHSLEREEKNAWDSGENPEKALKFDPYWLSFVKNAKKWNYEITILNFKVTKQHVLELVESSGLTILNASVKENEWLASRERCLFILRDLTMARALLDRGHDVILCRPLQQVATEGEKIEGVAVCAGGWQDIELLEIYNG